MPLFGPETPIGHDVQVLLMEQKDGLTVGSIRRALRLKGKNVNEANLQELLDHKLFVALADGRYVLSGNEPEPVVIDPTLQIADVLNRNFPWLPAVPAAICTYVVFDLETTGTDPGRDHIFQIAALKVVDGQVKDVKSWYINPTVEIPYTLRLKLGLEQDAAIGAAIAAAPPIADVLPQFLDFAGSLPLVAHNGRFDVNFINATVGDPGIDNPTVDTMELALLLLPHAIDHRLETVADTLGLTVDSLAEEWETLKQVFSLGEHTVGRETLHNALTDVYVLYRVYAALLDRLQGSGPEFNLLRSLLPELYDREAVFSGVDYEALQALMSQCDWALRPRSGALLPSAEAGLRAHLAATGRIPRSGQLAMQSLIGAALDSAEFAMIEAPTGTGKTLAYLAPAVYHAQQTGQPVVLSTAYKNLQDQLLGEIASFRASTGADFSSQLLKGVGNYLCWSQMLRYLEDGDPTLPKASHTLTLMERIVLYYVVVRLAGSDTGTVDTIDYWLQATFPGTNGILTQLLATSACDPRIQDTCAHCPMPNAYANAVAADIVILNHALWLSNLGRLPNFANIILDEAHTLEDVATEALTQETSSKILGRLIDHLFDLRTERGLLVRLRASASDGELLNALNGTLGSIRRIKPYLTEFGRFMTQFIRRTTGKVDPRYGGSLRLEASPAKVHPVPWQSLSQAHGQLFELYLQDLLISLQRVKAGIANSVIDHKIAILRELDQLIDDLIEQKQLAADIIRVADRQQVYWLEIGPPIESDDDNRNPVPEWWAYRSAPIDVGKALQPYYDALDSACLVSATLTTRNHDFSYFISRLGLSERLQSTFVQQLSPALPYASNVLLGLVDYLTYTPLERTMASFVEELAHELELFLNYTDGRALGLFTARTRMEDIGQRIGPSLAENGIPLMIATANQSRKRLLEDFKAHRESVLFGLRSFWEGVDAPGETLSFVLMEKLPFPLLISPVHRARAEYLQSQGKSEFDDYMLPLMLLQFKQGFGRLMRHENDRGAVILYDRRIHRKPYKADLLASLPGFIPRLDDAERSRRGFYERIAQVFPGLIDLPMKQDLLNSLPPYIGLAIDEKLDEFRLPTQMQLGDYADWRPTILRGLQALFDHSEFRTIRGEPVQEQVIQHILAGDDVLAIMPTGSGKSLTFQLTALLREGVTLVFSPLIALMKDQVGALNEAGIEVVGAIYSGQTASERDDVLDRMQQGRARLVYISPERLRDPQLLAALAKTQVIQVVIDEAHCVYMWGQSFRPDFLYVPRLFELLGYRPPIAALTATATPEIQQAIIETLHLRDPKRIIAPIERPELRFIVYSTKSRYGIIASKNDRFKQLLAILQAADRDRPSILVYVATTVEADQLARHLRVAGYDARAYHGKMDPTERSSVQELFMDDHINIVVCTKAFGMGIDKSDIRYVIHYNMPGDLESYFQEAGRAGRDRKTSYCILLYHKNDIGTQEFFIDNGTPDAGLINELRASLAAEPGTFLFVDPEALQERLGLEEVQLKVGVHHLESQGYLRRHADFSLTGSLTFQVTPEQALGDERLPEPDREILHHLLAQAGWDAYRKYEVDLLHLAHLLNVEPTAIDRVLLALSSHNLVVYRPWKRGFVIEKLSRIADAADVQAGDLAVEAHRRAMHHKLAHMVAYVDNQSRCREQVILSYFGQTVEPCGHCDMCAPEEEWPWSLVTRRDFATPDAYADPAFTILEAVKWNMDRARKYDAPYGIGTLMAVMTGNQYMAVKHEMDFHLKQWRLQQLRSCPQWGIFSVLPKADDVLKAMTARLLNEGYITDDTHEFEGGTSYHFFNLTDKGVKQLTSGRELQW